MALVVSEAEYMEGVSTELDIFMHVTTFTTALGIPHMIDDDRTARITLVVLNFSPYL